jgi:hypothetical protein
MLFLAVGGMLMDADRRGVDHLHIAVVSCGNTLQKPIPDAGFAPAVEAVHAGGIRAIARRNVRPRRACPKSPEDAVENLPVVRAFNAPHVVGQQRFNHRPLKIRQIKASHAKLPLKSLNHCSARLGIPFMGM